MQPAYGAKAVRQPSPSTRLVRWRSSPYVHGTPWKTCAAYRGQTLRSTRRRYIDIGPEQHSTAPNSAWLARSCEKATQ